MEFIPPPQLPTGLAEETARLNNQRKSNWEVLAQSLSGAAQQGFAGLQQRRQMQMAHPMLTPEQQMSMGLSMSAPGPAQPGQQGPVQSLPGFQKGMPMSLAENILQRKTQQDIAKETTERNIESANLRAGLSEVPVNEMHKEQYKKVYGHDLPLSTLTQKQEKELADQFKAKSSPTLGLKDTQFKEKRLTQLGDALDPSKMRSGAFATSKVVYDRAERLQTLASAFKDGNLDSRQIEEMAIGLNSMLSGSNVGAQSQVAALVPKTISGNVQKFKEWLVNDPQGTNQQEFVKRMLGSIEREKSTADVQMKRTKFQRISRYKDVEQSDPEGFRQVLRDNGVEPEEWAKWKKEGSKAIDAVQKPEGSSKKPHELTDEELLNAL